MYILVNMHVIIFIHLRQIGYCLLGTFYSDVQCYWFFFAETIYATEVNLPAFLMHVLSDFYMSNISVDPATNNNVCLRF